MSCTSCNQPACNGCPSDPCDPCSTGHTVVFNPLGLCYLIDPCTEGCEDTTSSDCIIMSQTIGAVAKGMTLTEAVQVMSSQLIALAIVYNATAITQLVIFSFLIENYTSFTVVVKRDNLEVLNMTYLQTELDDLLSDLQALDATWTRTDSLFQVRGTSQWEVTITY